jgi:haloalkane dehalogenase
LPFERGLYRLRTGPDAGRTLHVVMHGRPDAAAADGGTARRTAVLLLHGNPAWSFLWRRVIGRLDPRRFFSVAPDLLGFGLSDKLPAPSDHQLVRHGDALVELVQALDLRDLILVGQDWGGPMVTQVGSRCPGRVAAVVLGNTSVMAPPRPRGTLFHRFSRLPLISDLVFKGLGFPQNLLFAIQGDKSTMRGEVARAYTWPLERVRDRAGPLGLARMVPDGPGHPSLPPIARGEAWLHEHHDAGRPLALVWGLRDPLLGGIVDRHVQAFPQARVTRTQAGHFLQEEVPDELAAAIEWAAGAIRPRN